MNNNKLFLIKYLFFLINYNFISNAQTEETKVEIKINFLNKIRNFFLKEKFQKITKKYLIEKSFCLVGFLFINYKINSLIDENNEIKLKIDNLSKKNEIELLLNNLNKNFELIKSKLDEKNYLNLNDKNILNSLTDSIKNITNSNNNIIKIIKIFGNFNQRPIYPYSFRLNNNLGNFKINPLSFMH